MKIKELLSKVEETNVTLKSTNDLVTISRGVLAAATKKEFANLQKTLLTHLKGKTVRYIAAPKSVIGVIKDIKVEHGDDIITPNVIIFTDKAKKELSELQDVEFVG